MTDTKFHLDLKVDPPITDIPLSHIAEMVAIDWPKVMEEGTPTDFGNVGQHPANPYWQAMRVMTHINDKYGFDRGTEIVARFLGNANAWRGEVARDVKAELRRRLDEAREARA